MMTAQIDPPATRPKSIKKQTTVGGLALAIAVALYSFGQPLFKQKTGRDLPDLPRLQTSSPNSSPDKNVAADRTPRVNESAAQESANTGRPKPVAKSAAETPLATSAEIRSTAALEKSKLAESKLIYGLLKDLGDERFVSPAGLLYTRGGAEGHRLDHLERHTRDDPHRPGKHGVFDGGMKGAVATIDRAYERAKTGMRTTKEVDEGRIIYTVDMGSRIGYIGGQDGNRQKKPMARRVRIVLDQNRVITAYPL